MNSVRLLFTFLVFVTAGSTIFAQDQLIMMSGSVIDCKVIAQDKVFIEYERVTRNGKVKQQSVSRYEVFSILHEDGTETVLYQADNAQFNDYTVDQMRAYVNGELDARKNYKGGKSAFWIGLGVGAFSGYAGQANFLWTFGTPLVLSSASYIPNIRIREEAMSDTNYKFDNDYALGFERVSRTKLVMGTLKGSALGSAIGTASFLLFKEE